MQAIFKTFIVVLSFSSLISFTKKDCSILRNNQFTYQNSNKDVIVIFKDNKHLEYHSNRKYYIKSEIQWVSDCEYYLVIEETTLPRFPFKIGSKLHIVITKVKGNKVHYKSSLGGKTWKGKLTKMKKPR